MKKLITLLPAMLFFTILTAQTMDVSISRTSDNGTTQHFVVLGTSRYDFSTGSNKTWTGSNISVSFPQTITLNNGQGTLTLQSGAPGSASPGVSTYITNITSGFTGLNYGDAYSGSSVTNGLTFFKLSDNGGSASDPYVYFEISSLFSGNQALINGATVKIIEFDLPSSWGTGAACPNCLALVAVDPPGITNQMYSFITNNFSGATNIVNIVTPSAVLPVTLISFNAVKAGKTVNLNWLVSSEINAKGYDVERSNNAVDYTVIGYVAAGNNSKYSSSDASPLSGINYYRLKMTDIDGKFTYSEVRSVLFDGSNTVLFDIYPNPVITNKLYLQVQQYNYAGKAQAIITDIAGRTIQNSTITLVKGSNQLPIIIKNLKSGTYFVTVYDASGNLITQTKKLVKQ